MMAQCGSCARKFCRKAVHGLSSLAIGVCLVVLGPMHANQARAQSAAATPPAAAATAKPDQKIIGDWQGVATFHRKSCGLW